MNGINFINELYREINAEDYDTIIFDFNCTFLLETNLIAVIAYILEKIYSKKIKFVLKLNGYIYTDCPQSKIQNLLFDFFSDDKELALMPRKLGNRNIKSEEELLLNDLKTLQLHDYYKVRIIISELIANLKMHTIYQEGTISGYHDYKNNTIIFTIVNYDITIAKRGKITKNMEFQNDYEAFLWALRKNNTTRQANESGGIGLFLLRKYINHINGKFMILSGEYCLECTSECYNPEDENNILIKKVYKLGRKYEGTIITLFIPDKKLEVKKTEKRIDEININMEWLGR